MEITNRSLQSYFNPRSREGSDRHQSVEADLYAHFNPRSREGSDDDGRHISNLQRKFQSTLPRGERRRLRLREHGRKSISIHAPARGATFCHLLALLNTRNFNPRSREGSDSMSTFLFCLRTRFQSTLPRGERHTKQTFRLFWCPISIHAPARGATSRVIFSTFVMLISIHAPARGATQHPPYPVMLYAFQSTLPRGERHSNINDIFDESDFNPRSREGSDTIIHVIMGGHILFQSTLPRGERHSLACTRRCRC